jgi:nucleoside-diphosphate-sugar epimerase
MGSSQQRIEAAKRRLRAAASAGCKVLIVRAGDFFGPAAANNWFSQGLVKPGQPVSIITSPGAPGIGHQWAYLPDVAETMTRLLERSSELERSGKATVDFIPPVRP